MSQGLNRRQLFKTISSALLYPQLETACPCSAATIVKGVLHEGNSEVLRTAGEGRDLGPVRAQTDIEKLRAAIETRYRLPFADAVRLHLWSVFGTIERFARDLGVSRSELDQLLRAYDLDLMYPPALALQNQDLSAWPTIAVSREEVCAVGPFLAASGQEAEPSSQARISCDRNGITISVTCREPCPDRLTVEVLPGTSDPIKRAFRSGDLVTIGKQLRGRGLSSLHVWAEQFGALRESVLLDDCIVIFITALGIGQDRSVLFPAPFVPDPAKWLEQLTPRKANRVFLEGAYYAIAINPKGAVLDVFFDPWNYGTICPAWPSRAEVSAKRGDDSWRIDAQVPWQSLKPNVNENSVWGVDLARIRRCGAAPGQMTRSKRSTLIRCDVPQHNSFNPLPLPPNPSVAPVPLVPLQAAREFPTPDQWAAATRISRFIENQSGERATDITARIAYDATKLYVRFDCREEDISRLQVVTREEEVVEYGPENRRCNYLDRRENGVGLHWGDYVEVILAPNLDYADRFHGGTFDFLVNSRGELLERYYDTYGMFNVVPVPPWHSGSRVRVARTPHAWAVELAIPLGVLCTMGKISNKWGLNLHRCKSARITGGHEAHLCWSPTGVVYEGGPTWPDSYKSLRNGRRLGIMRIEGHKLSLRPQSNRPGPAIARSKPAALAAIRRRGSDGLRRVCFVDRKNGWVVGGLGTILHTGDAGATWTEQESGSNFILESVVFVDEKHGWAVGGWPRDTEVSLHGGMGVILATTDGGRHWIKQIDSMAVWLKDLFFLDRRLGWAVGEKGVILRTTNGGLQWEQITQTGTVSWLYGVHFTDPLCGWAVGHDETILRSENGGRSWSLRKSPVANRPFGWPVAWRAVKFAGPQRGWIVGDGGNILHTRDGGDTWQRDPLCVPDGVNDMLSFEDLQIAPDGTAWVVSPMSLMKKSSGDGGWRLVRIDSSNWLRGVSFVDGENGWLVGERGAILRTTNGGSDWVMRRGSRRPVGVLYATAHQHHIKGVPLGALGEDFDTAYIVCERGLREFERGGDVNRSVTTAAARAGGVDAVHTFVELDWLDRYWPHCVAQRYQNYGGIDAIEKRLVAVIRALRPHILIAGGPVVQEGYYAHGVGEVARALIRAFDSAANPARFPDLLTLGLEPFAPDKLYVKTYWANDLYRINPPTLRLRISDRFSERLGRTFADAKTLSDGCFWGILDRARPQTQVQFPFSCSLHLKRTRGTGLLKEHNITDGVQW